MRVFERIKASKYYTAPDSARSSWYGYNLIAMFTDLEAALAEVERLAKDRHEYVPPTPICRQCGLPFDEPVHILSEETP